MSRPTDHAWDALVEVTGANVSQERGALNRSLALIKEEVAELEVDGEQLATMILYQAGLYREVFPTMPLTATALAKWWGRLKDEADRLRTIEAEKASELEEKRKTRGTNRSAKNDCVTCAGNAYVMVGYRKPVQSAWGIEKGIKLQERPTDWGFVETAPCPVCNLDPPVMKEYWSNRSWTYGPAPGEVVIT